MNLKGPILLLITAVLWGLAFVAQTSASAEVGPLTFNASRNFIGAAFLVLVIAARKRSGHDKPPRPAKAPGRLPGGAPGSTPGGTSERASDLCEEVPSGASGMPAGAPYDALAGASGGTPSGKPGETSDGEQGYSRRTLIVAGVSCGLVLCVSSYLQQAGITSYPAEAAVAGRSGFITALYMVMVAVMAQFAGKRQHPVVWLAVAVAMAGMYLLCVPEGIDNVYLGDWLTLACAFGYALHIMVIDRFTQVDGVRLSQLQLITAGTISLVGALLFEHPDAGAILAAIVPILYAGICSDGIAYTFQIIAQQTTDPTVASILMSLESVFAALGGWIILSESLSLVELGGCALVFAAVMLAQVPDFIAHARTKSPTPPPNV